MAEGGETLIEILIAVAILGIVAVALAGGILTSLGGSEVNRQAASTDAVLRSAAAQVLAAARMTPWDSGTGCFLLNSWSTGTVTATPIGVSGCAGFQGIELMVPSSMGGPAQSLEIWVRQP